MKLNIKLSIVLNITVGQESSVAQNAQKQAMLGYFAPSWGTANI